MSVPRVSANTASFNKKTLFSAARWITSSARSMAAVPIRATWLSHGAFGNRNKGTDLGSVASETGQLTRFFNPREDRWSDHFRIDGPLIVPITAIGEVTVKILGFNSKERVLERRALVEVNRYPSEAALRLAVDRGAS